MTHEICSTDNFRGIFPELARTNRFKRKIDELMAAGFQFTASKAVGPFRIFKAKSGSNFKFRLKNHSNGKAVLLGLAKNEESWVPREWVAENPDWRVENDNEDSKHVLVRRQVVRGIGWSDIASALGKIIEEDLVEWHDCSKCHGEGKIPGFAHIANGVCFDCMGIGRWIVVKEKVK